MSRTIISNIIGGLGNQMFQYACAYAYANRTGATLELSTDMFAGYHMHQGYELHNVFSVSALLCTPQKLKTVLGWRSYPCIRKLLARHRNLRILDGKTFFEPHFHYCRDLDNLLSTKAYMHGYWQSERYFIDQSDSIRKEFVFTKDLDPANSSILNVIQSGPSASVHIRRGDYLNSKNSTTYGICDLNYYNKAISLLKSKVPNISLFVFSDDSEWARNVFLQRYNNVVIIDHNRGKSSYNDMRLMSQCTHHIIANSSFSWWGAWLNPNQDKIVIAPSKWFLTDKNSSDLIPSKWIKL